ncbi:MAG: hypothetical protein QG654_383 [Patescibacteria group bacterium]|nr:hypothetical protein [Patescibacteria group bacterium]
MDRRILCASSQLIAAYRVLRRFKYEEFQPVLILEYIIKKFLQEKTPQASPAGWDLLALHRSGLLPLLTVLHLMLRVFPLFAFTIRILSAHFVSTFYIEKKISTDSVIERKGWRFLFLLVMKPSVRTYPIPATKVLGTPGKLHRSSTRRTVSRAPDSGFVDHTLFQDAINKPANSLDHPRDVTRLTFLVQNENPSCGATLLQELARLHIEGRPAKYFHAVHVCVHESCLPRSRLPVFWRDELYSFLVARHFCPFDNTESVT